MHVCFFLLAGTSIITSEDPRAKCPEDLRYQERIVLSPMLMSREESKKHLSRILQEIHSTRSLTLNSILPFEWAEARLPRTELRFSLCRWRDFPAVMSQCSHGNSTNLYILVGKLVHMIIVITKGVLESERAKKINKL